MQADQRFQIGNPGLACFIRERAMRGEVESFCAPLRQVAPSWRRI